MRFLLDVNVLLALGFEEHEFHGRAARWYNSLPEGAELATCLITELAFVRILSQLRPFRVPVKDACALLEQLKLSTKRRFTFIADDLAGSVLPEWANSGAQTTDGHLVALARRHGCELVTFDAAIPTATLLRAE